jgi:NTE family protein
MAGESNLILAEHLRAQPFTLAMSSGFFGFFAHAGALAALLERNLHPARVVGSSAGGLVAGLYAAGVPTEEIRDALVRTRRDDFWDPDRRAVAALGLLRGQKFDAILRTLVGDTRAEECKVPVAITAFAIRSRTTRLFACGDLATIIRASCAFPLLFQPVRLDGALYSDGGILDRSAAFALAPGERVLFHHLPSKSPWRFSVPKPPARANAFVVQPPNLPRLSPFHLKQGAEAYAQAKAWMHCTLREPIGNVPQTKT